MPLEPPRWNEISPSQFPWERDALDYLRARLPGSDPHRAWANFEFVTDQGRVYEVDLLVLTRTGLHLIEIKSHSGRIEGDSSTWIVHRDGRRSARDNPLRLANTKAKLLRSLLERQPAARAAKGVRVPFVQPMIFLSDPGLACRLDASGRINVYGRDRDGDPAADRGGSLPGIVRALTTIPPERMGRPATLLDIRTARMLEKALQQAGVRPSTSIRRVGSYELGEILGEGPGFQDFLARHTQLAGVTRRVRRYTVSAAADESARQTLARAAQREFRILEGMRSSAILPAREFLASDLGPCLVFDHDPRAVRLDRWLAQRGHLEVGQAIDLMRQITEAVAYAHGRHVTHRTLSPGSIQVVDPDAPTPRVWIGDWQAGAREAAGTSVEAVSGTLHVDRLVQEDAAAYVAPEAYLNPEAGVPLDVFSLGAIAYLVFSGRPPAGSLHELTEVLHADDGLRVEAALDGAPDALRDLVFDATRPNVADRTATAADVLAGLDLLEEELTDTEAPPPLVVDPAQAGPNDELGPGLVVARRLGRGATAVAYEVTGDPPRVLKVAVDPDHDQRLRDEADTLRKLRHPGVVELLDVVDVAGRVGLVMARAGTETLAHRLAGAPLGLDVLQRLGDDLLETLVYLEGEGVAHRDIKPANLGIGPRGKAREIHLVLFDFSLTRTPREQIQAGTPPYLEPFLELRPGRRWDEAADRYAAAVTLHEMTTRRPPLWGDGRSNPAYLDVEATVSEDDFEPEVAVGLAAFFRRALRRDPAERFADAADMRQAWAEGFADTDRPAPDLEDRLAAATRETSIGALGVQAAAVALLSRHSVFTVEDLLETQVGDLVVRPGVSERTRRTVIDLARRLGELFPDVEPDPDHAPRSLDLAVPELLPVPRPQTGAQIRVLRLLLGLDRAEGLPVWPGIADVARAAGMDPAEARRLLATALARWRRKAVARELLVDARALMLDAGLVMSAPELASGLLALRGSAAPDDERARLAAAAARAAIQMAAAAGDDAWALRREWGTLLVAADVPGGPPAADLLDHAAALGRLARELAHADPPPTPAVALERLAAVPAPAGTPPHSETRLVRLAAAAGGVAASGRLELYPRGLDPVRALRLTQGALSDGRRVTPEQMQDRVRARFPEAAPLPGRPALDALVTEAGLQLIWDPADGAYRPPAAPETSLSATRSTVHRVRTGSGAQVPEPEVEQAGQFEDRLRRLRRDGGFLVLGVPAHRAPDAERELGRLEVTTLDLDALLIDAMKQAAAQAGADWTVVERADAAPAGSADHTNLRLLARRALPEVERVVAGTPGTVLLVRPGLLARYDAMPVLERLRDGLSRGELPALRGLWVLVPDRRNAALPMVDGVAVPIITPAQWARIPESWLANRHRAAPEAA